MKNFNYLYLIPSFLILIFLSSCSTSNDSDEEELIISPKPVTNSLYTTKQWETSSPSEEGMDPDLLEAALANGLADGSFTQSAIVIRNEKIVMEQYRGITEGEKQTLFDNGVPEQIVQEYDYRNQYDLASSWSTAKSFISILVGIAIDKGYIESIEEPASIYINEWENDARSEIKIKDLLNMRSGLVPICRNYEDGVTTPIICTSFPSSGGDLIAFPNLNEICINRELAEVGVIQPWYTSAFTWEQGYFLYINCDTQVLGEILERATGSGLETFAEVNLFSKIGFDNYWWRDKNDNYTAYCCLDATPRDFAKLGQLILNMGMWGDERIVSEEYIGKIIAIYSDYVPVERDVTYSYGMHFWTFSYPITQSDGVVFPAYPIYSAIGFDGQYIIIDFVENMVIVRNSLYFPWLSTGERIVADGDLFNELNFPMTLPNTMGIPIYFDRNSFMYQINQAIIQ